MQPVIADSDEMWAQRAQKDPQAFEELVRRYADRIYNLAYRMTGNRTEAEDMAQEAFIRAYRGLPGFKPELQFGAWLYRIAVNVCLTNRRHQITAVADPLPDDVGILDDALGIEDLAEQHEVKTVVEQAILSLPVMYRTVVILYHLEDRPYEEIAKILNLPLNTVRTHLHRGRALLREKLADKGASGRQ
jgi:RNA polymerase sigma-70 factor, ECF subfamily